MTAALAEEADKAGVFICSMHPGWTDTPGVARSLPGFRAQMGTRLRTPAQGADTIVWAALSDEPLERPNSSSDRKYRWNGAFFQDRRPKETHLWLTGWATRTGAGERMRLVQRLDEIYRQQPPAQ